MQYKNGLADIVMDQVYTASFPASTCTGVALLTQPIGWTEVHPLDSEGCPKSGAMQERKEHNIGLSSGRPRYSESTSWPLGKCTEKPKGGKRPG